MRATIVYASDSYYQGEPEKITINSLEDLKRLFHEKENDLILSFCESPESVVITVYDDYLE